ncbi:placenta-specific gene 8 protein-like isoform X1 [Biomphalaria glabrata]|uniref:Placenta-specific gene 8 protein-like isoform X1 n=1 Tax=Biomphalaria glabrata TaxID=6526 RepID=A0A9W2ZBR9_BIOGL|nr:placenta-specific gene 8 protein-like isoform X1 [Biomphalaria glabrata]
MDQFEFMNWQQPANESTAAASTTTNIIITTQPQIVGQGRTIPPPRNWISGLCACFEDCSSCLLACFCPCLLQCMIAQDMGESCCNACCYVCCNPASHFGLRVFMKGRENIQGSLNYDASITSGCLSLCCYTCALAQLAREVKFVKSTRMFF